MSLPSASLGSLGPGDHVCLPYESDDEKRSTLVVFLGEGLARQDRCLSIATPDEQAEVVAALEAAGVAARRAVARGALVFVTADEVYRRRGRFDADDALAALDGFIDRALADGFAGLRATGESSRQVPDDVWPAVLSYEARLNEHFARRPFVGLCRFPAAHVSALRLADVLRTHPLALVRGALCENPFYERAELALSDDSRARYEWQLHQLRTHHRARRHLESMAESAATEAAALQAQLARAEARARSEAESPPQRTRSRG